MFMCTLYVQRVLGHSPAEAGLAFPPFNLSVVAGSLIGPRLTGRIGAAGIAVLGALLALLLVRRAPRSGVRNR